MSKKQNKKEEEKIKEFFIGDGEVNKEQEKMIQELKEENKYDDYINNGISTLTKFLNGNNQLAQEIDMKYKDIYDKCISKKDDIIICDTNLLYDYLYKNDEIKNCLVEMKISEDVEYEKSKRFFIFDVDDKEENKEEKEMSNNKEENKNKEVKKEIVNETKKKEEKKNEKDRINKEDNAINKKIEDGFSRNKKNFILFNVYPDELKDYKNCVRNLTLSLVNNNRKAMKMIINYKDFYENVNKSKEDIYNFIWYNKDLLKSVIKEMYDDKNTDINIEDYEFCKSLFNFNKMVKINKSKKVKVETDSEGNKIIDVDKFKEELKVKRDDDANKQQIISKEKFIELLSDGSLHEDLILIYESYKDFYPILNKNNIDLFNKGYTSRQIYDLLFYAITDYKFSLDENRAIRKLKQKMEKLLA